MKCYGFHMHGAPADKAWEVAEMIRDHMGEKYNVRVQHNDEHFPGLTPSFWRRRRIVWMCMKYVRK